MRMLVVIALGGALGALARYGLDGVVTRGDFPVGTLVVNLAGSFVLGFLLWSGLLSGALGPEARMFATIGFLGAFTTMSTFAVETLSLAPLQATLNIVGNTGGSLLAALLGRSVASLAGVGP